MKYIKESTEFGLDMVRGLPRVWHAVQNNIEHQVHVKPGLKDLYGLFTDNVVVKSDFVVNHPTSLFQFERPDWTLNEWTPPPLKEMFKDKVSFDKPTIVINNKWDGDLGPKDTNRFLNRYPDIDLSMGAMIQRDDGFTSFNHYSMEFIDKLVKEYSDRYKIIYISPIFGDNYFKDNNRIISVDDYGYIEKNYPEIYTIKEHMKRKNISYNIAQFELEASSDKHLSVMGGNCKISSYFGGDVIIHMGAGYKYGEIAKGKRGIFKTGSWLRHLSGANIIQFNTYKDIFNYIGENW